jgi:hypothetical protein
MRKLSLLLFTVAGLVALPALAQNPPQARRSAFAAPSKSSPTTP